MLFSILFDSNPVLFRRLQTHSTPFLFRTLNSCLQLGKRENVECTLHYKPELVVSIVLFDFKQRNVSLEIALTFLSEPNKWFFKWFRKKIGTKAHTNTLHHISVLWLARNVRACLSDQIEHFTWNDTRRMTLQCIFHLKLLPWGEPNHFFYSFRIFSIFFLFGMSAAFWNSFYVCLCLF